MVKKEVREQLLSKLGITKQALSQRAKKLKETHGPMTTDEAVYVIAHMEGVDLSRHLPLANLDRVRALVPRPIPRQTGQQPQPVSKPPRRTARRPRSYPLVSQSLARSAVSLGHDVYPVLFLLESSIRGFISTRLSKTGTNWWDTLVPSAVRNNVARTIKKEARFPWREKRGKHPLYYANFADLKEIILANISHFSDVVVNAEWFKVHMEDVYMARNNLAHCVPLSKDDVAEINKMYRDWARMLDSAGVK
jgi:hypothetical protein